MANCPICESEKTKSLLNWKKYTIQKCSNCQLIFSTPLPSNQELEDYYQGFMFNKPEDYEIKRQIEIRTKELKRLFNLPNGSKNLADKRFLDYGGGTGIVYKTASDIGLNCYYSDLDEQAKQFTKTHFGLPDDKIIEEITSSDLTFDYIFSDNVIEHIRDPYNYVKNLLNHLDDKGKLVIKTPHASNTESIFNPYISLKVYFRNATKYNSIPQSILAYFKRFWHCDPPRHIYSFSKNSLVSLMSKFEEEDYDYDISYYKIPWFSNTITKMFFSKDKNLKGLSSILVRLILFPAIPIEAVLQLLRQLLLKLQILTPGGIILTVNKK